MTSANADVARAYQRWSRLYDYMFGSVLQAGRRQAVREMRLQAGHYLSRLGSAPG